MENLAGRDGAHQSARTIRPSQLPTLGPARGPVNTVKALEARRKGDEPTLVSLHGILIKNTFPDPPNYNGAHDGDAPESIWLLKLDSPIWVKEDKDEPDLKKPSQKNVQSVHLVIDEPDVKKLTGLVGKTVVASRYSARTRRIITRLFSHREVTRPSRLDVTTVSHPSKSRRVGQPQSVISRRTLRREWHGAQSFDFVGC